MRRELVTRLLGRGGPSHDRDYHWSDSGWLAAPSWLTAAISTAERGKPERPCLRPLRKLREEWMPDPEDFDLHDYDDYKPEEMPITPSVLAAEREQEAFKKDVVFFYRERHGYCFEIHDVDYTWLEFHRQGPGAQMKKQGSTGSPIGYARCAEGVLVQAL